MVNYNESINPDSILGQRKTIISIPSLYFGTAYNDSHVYSPIGYNIGTELINQISNHLTNIDKGKNLLLSYNGTILPNLGFITGENWVYNTIYDSLFVRIKKIDNENVIFLSNMLYGKNYSTLLPFLTGTSTYAVSEPGGEHDLNSCIKDLYNNSLREGVIANSTDYNSNNGYIGYYTITSTEDEVYQLNLMSNGNYQSFTLVKYN